MSPRAMRLLPLLVMLALAAALSLGLFGKGRPEPNGKSMLGYEVAPFEIPAFGGQAGTFTAQSMRGRIVLLNVFASWCAPCELEHPVLMRLAKTGRLAIYGIAWKDKTPKVADYLNRLGNPYQMLGIDEHGKSTIPLALTGVPETFLLDKDGVIRYHMASPLTDEMVNTAILPLLDKLTGYADSQPSS